ncbi:MAG TPA: hypothetical protein PLU50_00680, partial [Pseudobdellovibrionaceae bacterium]|nr:hypothetical protein [Pseudobdellovibrionaceae bacterium]
SNRFPDMLQEVQFPLRQKIKATVIKSIMSFLMAILLQFFLQKYFFGKESRFFVTFLFNLLIVGHYAFWKSRFAPLNIFDLDVMSLTEGIGNVLWFILLARIRYYYLPENQIKKIPRSLEQATLMTMGELLPTYLTLFAVFWMLSYPFLANSVNLPSQYLLENLFRFGIPIIIALIIVLPIVEHSGWIKNSKMVRSWNLNWNFSPRFLQWSFYLGTVVVLILPLAYLKQPWMALSDPQNLARDFRGHGPQLEYLAQKDDFKKNQAPFETPISGLQQKFYHHYSFTPLGLRLLPQVDLQGFAFGMKELLRGTQWGYFEDQRPNGTHLLPLTAQANMGDSRILDLYLSSGQSSVPLKSLIEESITQEPAEIYRERMASNILVTGSLDNLKLSAEKRTPTLWTDFILKEIQNHYWDSLIVLVFIYLLLAIYLNSFIRSFLLLTFLMLMTSFNICLRWLIPISFSIDSLWMIPTNAIVCFAILLILTRIVDVERSRGIDRDLSISDLRAQLLMPIACSAIPFAISFIYKPLMNGGQGFWFEGGFLGLFQLINLSLLSRYIYPIFYLESEEFIEKKIYNTYLRWKKRQMKVWSKPS